MTKPKYEIEEETGGYVRNGDVLEWVPKGGEAPASSPTTTEDVKPKPKNGRRKAARATKAKK